MNKAAEVLLVTLFNLNIKLDRVIQLNDPDEPNAWDIYLHNMNCIQCYSDEAVLLIWRMDHKCEIVETTLSKISTLDLKNLAGIST